LEDLRSQFHVFGEGLEYVSDTLDQHTATLDKHTTQLQEITRRMGSAETDLAFVKEQLAIIRHNQVTRDEFRLLETRVSRLERARQK
jgi:uncharacterized coiled-coil protein SlyX